jgi:FMN phosphatase YigB (HAD superfamily)
MGFTEKPSPNPGTIKFILGEKMKTVIFDLGGTVIDSKSFSFEKGLKKLHDQLAPQPPFMLWQKRSADLLAFTYQTRKDHLLEIPFREYLAFFLKGLRLEGNPEELEISFLEAAETVDAMPGIADCLKTLKTAGYQLLALSNSAFSARTLKQQLKKIGVLSYFDEVYSSADNLVRKPCPLLFELILAIHQLNPEETAMIGNDYRCDIVPAVKLGLKTFWYTSTGVSGEDVICFSDYLLLPKLIENKKTGSPV